MDILSIEFLSSAYIFFSAGLAFLLSVAQLSGRSRYFENYVLAAYLFCLGVIFLQICVVVNDIHLANPGLLAFHATALYFMAPIICLADYLVIRPPETIPKKTALMFLPVLLGLAADAGFMLLPAEGKRDLLVALFAGGESPYAGAARIVIAGAGIEMLLYLGYLLKTMLTTRGKDDNPVIFLVMTSSIFVVAGLSALIIAGYLAGSYTLLRWGANLIGLLVIITYLVSQRHPKILQLLMIEAEKKQYGRSLLAGVDVEGAMKKLERLMETERIYADDQLTLRDLADELSLTPHQLSQLLNERLGTNFNAYVNQYRIREACDILLNRPEMTVLAVSLEVGFNSKSAFYEAFTRFTGTSPQNYRKRGTGG